MTVGEEEETRPAQKLAGKRARRVVMRNGSDANRFRSAQRSGDISGMEAPDSSSSLSPQPLTEAQRVAQRDEALRNANLTRMERAATKRRLEAGQLDFDTFLDETPEACRKVRIGVALGWLPYIGPARVQRLLIRLLIVAPDVDVNTMVCELSAKAKYALSHHVRLFYGHHTNHRRSRAG